MPPAPALRGRKRQRRRHRSHEPLDPLDELRQRRYSDANEHRRGERRHPGALREDADLLSAEEIEAIPADLAELRHAAGGTDHRVIKLQIEHVNRATEPFATRRMDRSVKRALTGRNVESIGS